MKSKRAAPKPAKLSPAKASVSKPRKSAPAPAASKAPGVDMIETLAALLKATDLTEIEIEQAGLRIRVSRQSATAVYAPVASPGPVLSAPAKSGADAAPAEMPRSEADTLQHPGLVTSPMVGTAYSAPQPGAAPFVKIGDAVKEGQTILIVEAMKTMNPIPAHRSGKVTRIFVNDSQPVEFGEPLLLIE